MLPADQEEVCDGTETAEIDEPQDGAEKACFFGGMDQSEGRCGDRRVT